MGAGSEPKRMALIRTLTTITATVACGARATRPHRSPGGSDWLAFGAVLHSTAEIQGNLDLPADCLSRPSCTNCMDLKRALAASLDTRRFGSDPP